MNWLTSLPNWITQAAGVASAMIILLTVLTQMRDLLVSSGFAKDESWLARTITRTHVRTARSVLTELGFDTTRVAGVRRWHYSPPDLFGRPDRDLLAAATRWTFRLEDGYTYNQQKYYLDIMGAMTSKNIYPVSAILEEWIAILVSRKFVEPYDIVLTPKDGNVLLGKAVSEGTKTPLVLVKGGEDRSRVLDPGDLHGNPHETDFEGLREVLDCLRASDFRRAQYKAVIIDDSCANGTQIASCATRYNAYISMWNSTRGAASRIELLPVTSAVVLFRYRKEDGSNHALQHARVNLHALVALGPTELAKLATVGRRSARMKFRGVLKQYKQDDFACAASLGLGVNRVGQRTSVAPATSLKGKVALSPKNVQDSVNEADAGG